MIAILSALAPVFLITALGYALVHTKVATEHVWHSVDQLTYFVLFPALLTKTLARADLTAVPAGNFLFVVLGSVTIMAAILLAMHLTFRGLLTGPAFTSVFQGGVRFQSVVAVALSAALFGERGVTFAAIAVASIVPVVQFYTMLVLLTFGSTHADVSAMEIGKRMALNPFTLACLIGLVLNATGLPDFAYETLSILGAASVGLTLLSVGAGLNVAAVRASGSVVAATMAMRLIGMPMLVFALSSAIGLDGLGRTIAIIAAGVPTAATAYTMARKLGGDASLMAQIITFQTIGAAFTLPVMIYLSR